VDSRPLCIPPIEVPHSPAVEPGGAAYNRLMPLTALRPATDRLAALLLACTLAPASLGAATFTVDSTLDDPDQVTNGVCASAAGDCTLRAAIQEANSTAGPAMDLISFAIPGGDPGCDGAGICVIEITGVMPDILSPTTIDGSSQPGNEDVCLLPIVARPAYKIVLDGDGTQPGLRPELNSNGSIIKGLNIRNFSDAVALIQTQLSVVQCNFIGTDETGTSAIPNTRNAVILGCDADFNLIGGPSPADANLLSGNDIDGVQMYGDIPCPAGGEPDDNTVQGNSIGLAKDGLTALGNGFSGVSIFGDDRFPANNLILDNVIAASSGAGVFIGDFIAGTEVQGNFIGTDPTGSVDLGNATGVYSEGDPGTLIGGPAEGDANVVAFSTFAGVVVGDFTNAGMGNTIQRNSIYANGALGIDLGDDGATANDAGDADSGANGLQNFPDIASVALGPASFDVTYSVDSTTPLTVEFFAAEAGEGRVFLGEDTYNGGSPTVMLATGTPGVQSIVGTATDTDGNTSEFSMPATVPPIFSDGFESGDTSAWSTTVP